MSGSRPFTFGSLLASLMLLAGLATGPGYYFYCTWFTGKHVGEYPIRAEGRGIQPVTLPLDPDMNPIGMDISAFVIGSAGDAAPWIGMTLHDGRTRLLEGLATFKIGKDGAAGEHTVILGSFSVPRADRYTVHFNGALGSSSGPRLSNPRLLVRRNMKEPNMTIVWWGVAILVASFLASWLAGDVGTGDRNRDD